MADTFREKIRAALANSTLQDALDGNAERRLQARLQAFASLPEGFEALRQRAHVVRSQTLANLDHFLEQFVSHVRSNGLSVHFAEDAAQAVEIVLRIARSRGARIISKSKTMVGEEIHLNQALEAEGFRVVETDLGEYIIQLRGEPPSHIITPAVHLTRGQVGVTFQERLGVPFTDDIPSLTAIARKVLRQTFLDTDIGISGVNFGVAESGTLCLLTNEGNGRMVTTLPKVHLAIMGIERLVPTLDDLVLMLSLLPRSATGQKLTVYVSLIHSPRRSGEVDGAEERHLILVDNGRRALRRSLLAEILYCIRCGACLNACPVFREISGHAYVGLDGRETCYTGPIGSVLSPGLFGVANFGHLARASSLCGACKEACPVDIDLPKLLLRVRAEGANLEATSLPHPTPLLVRSHVPAYLRLGLWVFTRLATSAWRFHFAQRMAGLFGWLVAPFSPWIRMPTFTGWGLSRDFPRPAKRPFRDCFSPEKGQSVQERAGEGGSFSLVNSSHIEAQRDLVRQFEDALTALGGAFTRCESEELVQRILELLHERGVRVVQAWDETHLPDGLLRQLQQAGILVSEVPDPEVTVGITGALAGIAETGTLVLTSGSGQPLTASLLPEIHLAILRKKDIYENLRQVFSLPQVRESSSTILISGPSRTADIEMTLTIGVHGPREVQVVCVE